MANNTIVNQAKLASPPEDPRHLAHKQYVDDSVAELRRSLGTMALASDAPSNGLAYGRQNGAWQEIGSGSGGAAPSVAAIAGEIRLLPFRSTELPTGWYFCNGDRYGLDSPQGEALNALPFNFKADWGIAVTGANIGLPNLFANGEGYFLRPVNNTSRLPGTVQDDAIRNITGTFGLAPSVGLTHNGSGFGSSTFSGAFKSSGYTKAYSSNSYAMGYNTIGDLMFDASRSVATANENRPRNIGMTPAIYLGV